MVLKLHSQWKTFEDYLFSMTTKYRTRIKGVYKKSKELVIKSLSAEEIDKYQSEITSLLEHVSKKAEYSYGVISVKAFIFWANVVFKHVACSLINSIMTAYIFHIHQRLGLVTQYTAVNGTRFLVNARGGIDNTRQLI